MSEGYGNIGWQIFVYSCYAIVGLSLTIYIWASIFSRKKNLKNMQEEGFFHENSSNNNFSREKKE